MIRGRIAAFDLATVTGWAVGSVAGVESWGTFRIASTGADLGSWLRSALAHFSDVVAKSEAAECWYESPILLGMTNIGTLRKLYTLGPALEMVCGDAGVYCYEAQLGDIRTHFLGKGRRMDRRQLKIATKVRCRERGWDVDDDNEADALALLDFALATRNAGFGMRATPMFQEVENAN